MRSRRIASLAMLALVAVGCSGGGSAAPDTSTSPSSSSTTTSSSSTSSTSTSVATSTTVKAGPVYPLTGLPAIDSAAASRPALVVKIDNNRSARPQSGLNEADIVFEEIVEVQTRFAAVFQSNVADPVGPIRSGRTQDIDLLGSFNKPLFAWSGGNKNVTKAIEGSDLVSLSAQKNQVYQGGGFRRYGNRRSPHDLMADASKLFTLAPSGSGPPPQQFQYYAGDQVRQGTPAAGVAGEMFGLAITWTFDATTGLYARTSGGEPHFDGLTGAPFTTDNVVVMEVVYRPSPADVRSPEAQTIGKGTALVFAGGKVVHGTWSRPDRLSPILLIDADGNPILLNAGRTVVELARAGNLYPVP